MNFELTKEQQAYVDELRDFLQKEVAPGAAERDEQCQPGHDRRQDHWQRGDRAGEGRDRAVAARQKNGERGAQQDTQGS